MVKGNICRTPRARQDPFQGRTTFPSLERYVAHIIHISAQLQWQRPSLPMWLSQRINGLTTLNQSTSRVINKQYQALNVLSSVYRLESWEKPDADESWGAPAQLIDPCSDGKCPSLSVQTQTIFVARTIVPPLVLVDRQGGMESRRPPLAASKFLRNFGSEWGAGFRQPSTRKLSIRTFPMNIASIRSVEHLLSNRSIESGQLNELVQLLQYVYVRLRLIKEINYDRSLFSIEVVSTGCI